MTDVQREVEALAALLDCAVLIEDARHRPLWWSAQGEVDAVRSRTILQREVPPAAVALVTRMGLAKADKPVRTPALAEVDMAERWCMPVRGDRQLLGYLWVLDPTGRVAESDLPRVVECAQLAARTLRRAHPRPGHSAQARTALLTRLAAGPDDDAAAELIDMEGLRADARVAVKAPLSGSGWALPDGLSVHVDPAAAEVYTSGAPVPVADLAVAVYRASATLRALRAGARITAPTWDALGAWRLIVAAPADLQPGQIHPGVDALLAQKRPDLLVTARCVLDNGGEITASADQLHIHRTTLHYRLDRITRLTGVNLRRPDQRDDLHLAILLAAYRHHA